MDEHRKMAEKIYKEINEIRKFANEADESTESNRVWVETYGDITCDDIIPVIIEHALRSTASKSEKDGWNKAVEECAKRDIRCHECAMIQGRPTEYVPEDKTV